MKSEKCHRKYDSKRWQYNERGIHYNHWKCEREIVKENITKDYFVTKRQRVNSEMKNSDPEWEDLKTRVNKMIDSKLKE